MTAFLFWLASGLIGYTYAGFPILVMLHSDTIDFRASGLATRFILEAFAPIAFEIAQALKVLGVIDRASHHCTRHGLGRRSLRRAIRSEHRARHAGNKNQAAH